MGFSNPGFSQALQDAIDYAWENDVVLVAAVGNDALGDPTYPAGDRGVMGVSATDDADALADFSNSGLAVFLAAPGVNISSTALDAGLPFDQRHIGFGRDRGRRGRFHEGRRPDAYERNDCWPSRAQR